MVRLDHKGRRLSTVAARVPLVLAAILLCALAVSLLLPAARVTLSGLLVVALSAYIVLQWILTKRQERLTASRRLALQTLRVTVWQMQNERDITQVREAVGEALGAGGIDFREYGINLIDTQAVPHRISAHTRSAAGTWRVSSLDSDLAAADDAESSPGWNANIVDSLIDTWKSGQPLYRPDLQNEDIWEIREKLSARAGAAIRAVIDVPFSAGTLAVSSLRPQAFSPGDVAFLVDIAAVLTEGFHRLQDLRQLAKSEERYRTLVEMPPDTVVMLMTLDGRYLYISPQVETFTGFSPAQIQQHPQLLKQAVSPESIGSGDTMFQRAAAGQPIQRREFRIRHTNGTYYWVAQIIFPIRNSQGEVEAVQAVFQDISERRRAQESLLQSSRLISLGQMAAGLAHELNQPLTAISVISEGMQLLRARGVEISQEDIGEDSALMLEQVERMRQIIEHLRVFSRDTSSRPKEAVSVNTVVDNALKMVGAQLENHGIEVITELEASVPAVLGDPNRLEQVLLNLLTNARDSLDERGERERQGLEASRPKHLWIRTRRDEGHVVMEVEDRGVGISEQNRAILFQPFFTTKGPDRGTGLGLSIAYAIIQDHGGTLECDSVEGEGALFRCRLPVPEKAAAAEEEV